MKKISLLILILALCVVSCSGNNTSSKKSRDNKQNMVYMSSSEKAEYIISEDVTLNYLSDALTNESVKYYGKTEFGTTSLKIIDVKVENNSARVFIQFIYSGYAQKDDFFLRQASSNEQVAVLDVSIVDNGNGTLDLTDPKIIAISKNDNEYQGVVKDYFPQNKYLDVLKDRDISLKELQSMENSSVEDYLSSQNKQGMPYGDYDKYFSSDKK